jgi:hypothetical protein
VQGARHSLDAIAEVDLGWQAKLLLHPIVSLDRTARRPHGSLRRLLAFLVCRHKPFKTKAPLLAPEDRRRQPRACGTESRRRAGAGARGKAARRHTPGG